MSTTNSPKKDNPGGTLHIGNVPQPDTKKTAAPHKEATSTLPAQAPHKEKTSTLPVQKDATGEHELGNAHHVVQNPNGGWDVKRVGGAHVSAHADTKAEALQIAKRISDNQGTNIVIHGRDGKIQKSDARWFIAPEDKEKAAQPVSKTASKQTKEAKPTAKPAAKPAKETKSAAKPTPKKK